MYFVVVNSMLPSIVSDVSAIFVASTTFLSPTGVFSNARSCICAGNAAYSVAI